MTRHPNSLEFINYLNNTLNLIIGPIEEMAWSVWKEGDEIPDARSLIHTECVLIGMYFAQVNGAVSLEAAAFIEDVDLALLRMDDDFTISDFELKESIEELVVTNKYRIDKWIIYPHLLNYLQWYDEDYGTDFCHRVRVMFLRFANEVVKADGKICMSEENALKEFKTLLFDNPNTTITTITNNSKAYEERVASFTPHVNDIDTVFSELNSLIGLDRVKNDVSQLVNFLRVQQMRQEKGLAAQPTSRHLVFLGNPGTGKTTVARLIAQIYKSLGILSRGHLVETARAGLVAGYVGQTAIKVSEVVESALGGVLFIDEAYSLSSAKEGWDFGHEAVDTLIKLMEDNREDLVVIVAGYPEKMNEFLSSNPGLRSRFNKYFHFDDYTPNQLKQIFELYCANGGYKTTQSAVHILKELFSELYNNRDETFGNGRLVRNLYETIISNQANRIAPIQEISEEILSTIEDADLPTTASMQYT